MRLRGLRVPCFIASILLAGCSGSSFSGASAKKADASKPSPKPPTATDPALSADPNAPGGPTTGGEVDCTGISSGDCHALKTEPTTGSYRVVTCSDEKSDQCTGRINEAKDQDGPEHSKIVVVDCDPKDANADKAAACAAKVSAKLGELTDSSATGSGTLGEGTDTATNTDTLAAGDGETCVKTTVVPAQSLSTTNAPFLQKPAGEANNYGPWMDQHGTTPLPPKLVFDGLKVGDKITVTNITGTINDGDNLSGSCTDGVGSEQAILKHMLVMQFTNASDKVQDPGVATFNDFGAIPVRDLLNKPLTVPKNITRVYVGIGDTRYSDNHSKCSLTLEIKTHVPCKKP